MLPLSCPTPRTFSSPRLLLPIALIALLVPFTLALWWTHGIPSSSSLLPAFQIGYDSGDTPWDASGRNYESLGYTGSDGALERFAANVPAPEVIPELRRAPWAGEWGVPGVNPGEGCVGHGRYAVGRQGVGQEAEHGDEQDDLGGQHDSNDGPGSRPPTDDYDRAAPANADSDAEITPQGEQSLEDIDRPIPQPLSKKWLGSLSPSSSSPSSLPIPHAAFILMHFFSTPSHTSGPRSRRDLIRRTIFTSIPRHLRRFIDVKFVLAHAWDPALEQMIDREEAVYRDLIRLGTPDPKDTAERGLGVRWMEWLSEHTEGEMVEGAQREGVWVIKCSDDVLPILPNLIPYLLAQNPSVPTYFGSSLLTEVKAPPYFERHMSGFTWGVIKTLAAANLSDAVKDRVGDIGLLFGELMPSHLGHLHPPSTERSFNASLPLTNSLAHRQVEQPPSSSSSSNFISHAPLSPHPRTALTHLDAGALIAPFASPYAARGNEALGWYDIGDDFVYEFDAMAKAISDVRMEGRRYRWDAPPEMDEIGRVCEAAHGG